MTLTFIEKRLLSETIFCFFRQSKRSNASDFAPLLYYSSGSFFILKTILNRFARNFGLLITTIFICNTSKSNLLHTIHREKIGAIFLKKL